MAQSELIIDDKGQQTRSADSVATPASKRAWSHIPALDGVRGIAALMVMVYHFYNGVDAPHNSILRLIYRSTYLGQTGVDLFFVLSGFLITGILLSAKGHPRALSKFYMRRTLRIFPLYYGVLSIMTLVTILMRGAGSARETWWYWTYCQNIQMTFWPLKAPFVFSIGHFWSLAVEEQFYLVWPWLVLMLNGRNLIRVLFGAIVLSFLSRCVLGHFGYSEFFMTPCRLDALSMGALVAVMWQERGRIHMLKRGAWIYLIAVLPLLIPLYVMTSGHGFAIIQLIKAPLIAGTYTSALVLLLSAASTNPISRILSTPAAREVGAVSYGLYVFHPFAFAGITLALNRMHAWNAVPSIISLLLGLVATYVIAKLSWQVYEKQILKLKTRFDY